MRLTDTTPQEVVLALRSTGASDEDVLYAAKTEFAQPFRRQKIWGLWLGAVGVLVSLTVFGALLGIPAAGVGIWLWRKGSRNLAVIDAAFAEYQVPGRPVPTAYADYTAPSATAIAHARTDPAQPSDRVDAAGHPERTA